MTYQEELIKIKKEMKKQRKKHWTEIGKNRFDLHPSRLHLDKEFNLSKKIYNCDSDEVVHVIDVKEFIKRLKEMLRIFDFKGLAVYNALDYEIDNLAGDDLK